MAEILPEGTDHIVPGAAGTRTADRAADAARDKIKAGTADLREKIAAQTEEYRAQATDKARDIASQGKDKATGALHDVAQLLHDNARQIDDRIGSQYGDYARRAADAVTGAAEHLGGKDVDELLEDARTIIRKSPAIALGAAAAAGFFLARVIKSGSDTLAETARTVDLDTASSSATAQPKKTPSKSSTSV